MAANTTDIRTVIKTLGLEDIYFEKRDKISLQDVMTNNTDENSPFIEKHEVPWVILKKLVQMDYTARDEQIQKSVKYEHAWLTEDDLYNTTCPNEEKEALHPLDVQNVIFQCCDPMLQQVIAQKMFVCRLAIPFIIPGPGQTLTCYLWPLRSVIMNWRNSDDKAMAASLADHPMQMVSFIRLDKMRISKSKVMNDILSDKTHTFFHRDLSQGMTRRISSNGLIEISQYLPRNLETAIFTNELLFVNLRGNGCKYKKQVNLLCHGSAVVVIFLDVVNVKQHNQIIHQLKSTCRKIVFFLTCSEKTPYGEVMSKYVKPTFQSMRPLDNVTFVRHFEGNTLQNAQKVKTNLREAIATCLNSMNCISLETFVETYAKPFVKIDEKNPKYEEGKQLADKTCSYIRETFQKDSRTILLPFQGEHWKDWCSTQRDLFRKGANWEVENFQYELDKSKKEMKKNRTLQNEKCVIQPFFRNFIDIICGGSIDDDTIPFFLKQLQLYLNKLSREVLPKLKGEMQELRIQTRAQSQDVKHKAFYQIERQYVENSLGIEHFFRELAQIYEASPGRFPKLPDVVANMLVTGHPFELMDGDTATVPIEWINALFKSLQKKLGKDKTICTITIIGIQSSGKSTLLNAMFGLEFAVGSGRCTRGIFAYLFDVSKMKVKAACDYFLILDTEGLRAPEMAKDKYDHDNELATFVMGLGDLILINLMGENMPEMQDILQIVVHALVRMKIVDIFKQRKCLFVHQNVAATDAGDSLRESRYLLKDVLDETTRKAATDEGKDFKSFKNISDFDPEKHVYYLSPLWEGSPPMAPINTVYSNEVVTIKYDIFDEIKRLNMFSSFEKLPIFMRDLTNAVLAEDFIFSFRNSLESQAHIMLDSHTFYLIHAMDSELQQISIHEIQKSSTAAQLEGDHANLCSNILYQTKKICKKTMDDLEKFIFENSAKNAMEHWMPEKKNLIKHKAGLYSKALLDELNEMKLKRNLQLTQSIDKVETELITGAFQLAEQHRGKNIKAGDKRKSFDGMWKSIERKILPRLEHKSMEKEMKITMRDYFKTKGHSKYITTDISHKALDWPYGHKALNETYDDLCTELKIVEREMKQQVHTICSKAENHINNVCTNWSKYKSSYCVNLLEILYSNGTVADKAVMKIRLSPEQKASVAVHIASYACFRFKKAKTVYDTQYGLESELLRTKATMFSTYNHLVNETQSENIRRSEETSIADIFCDDVTRELKKIVEREMKGHMKHYFHRYVCATKLDVITKILTQFAEKSLSFQECMEYLTDSSEYAIKWMRNLINKIFFSKHSGAPTHYAVIATQRLDALIMEIKNSIRKANDKIKMSRQHGINLMREWTDEIGFQLRNTAIRGDYFSNMTLKPFQRGAKSLVNFEESAFKRLDDIRTKHVAYFENKKPSEVFYHGKTTVEHDIFEELWGCREQCPFCHEPCMRTDFNHAGKHECIQHRPRGLGGLYNHLRNMLVVEICSTSVTTKQRFQCQCNPNCTIADVIYPETFNHGHAFHQYSMYTKFFPKWDIRPDHSDAMSQYWKWFMKTHIDKLKRFYSCVEQSTIPQSWYDISAEDAIQSLSVYATPR